METFFKFTCPGCGQNLECEVSQQFSQTTCPSCEQSFMPNCTPQPQSTAGPLPPPKENRTSQRAEKVRSRALMFEVSALILTVPALGIAAKSLYNLIATEPAASGFVWAGVFIFAALGLYLIAQVIHIRANTEK